MAKQKWSISDHRKWNRWEFSPHDLYRLMLIRGSGKNLCVYSSNDHGSVVARQEFLIDQEFQNNPTKFPPEFEIFSINGTGFGEGTYDE